MGQSLKDNRRKYLRVDYENIVIIEEFSIPSPEIRKALQASIKNISAGGISFVSPENIEVGAVLKISATLKGLGTYKPEFIKPGQERASEQLTALAQVVRVEMLKSGQFEVCVSLVGVDKGHRFALDEFLKRKARFDAKESK